MEIQVDASGEADSLAEIVRALSDRQRQLEEGVSLPEFFEVVADVARWSERAIEWVTEAKAEVGRAGAAG